MRASGFRDMWRDLMRHPNDKPRAFICPCVTHERLQCGEPKCFHFTSNKHGQKACGLCGFTGRAFQKLY